MSDAEEPVHAPKYALYLGGRLGVLLYGGGMYQDQNGNVTKTSAYVGNGLALEADVGARISRRYIPYLALELGLVGPGSAFQGANASAGTSFLGIGFRFLAGDVNSVSFASDLSFGFRRFQVTNGSTWSASAFEFLRLGLGAEIRLTSAFTLSPMVTLSGGTLTDTSGTANFGPGQGAPPSFVNSGQIPSWAQTGYLAIVLGCGAHFDLFGAH